MVSKEDLFSVMLDLQREIGEKNLVAELNKIGWIQITFSPVSYFQGYVAANKWPDQREILEDLHKNVQIIANNYGFDIDKYNLIDIVPR